MVVLFAALGSCQGTDSGKAKDVDGADKTAMTVTIDSIIKEQAFIRVDSVEFLRMKMPPIFDKELESSLQSSIEAMFFYGLADALSSGKTGKAETRETMKKMLIPFQTQVKEYDKTHSKEYFFGMAHLKTPKDSLTSKAIFVIDVDDPSKIEQKIVIKKNKIKDYELILQVAYGTDERIEQPSSEVKNWKEVKENPIYQFILND